MHLTIQPVSRRNRLQVLNLTVAQHQQGFIETTAQCLKEARFLWLWRPVAIYADSQLVGFAMFGKFRHEGAHGRVWLDRFLIGAEYQGRGYGQQGLDLLCQHLKERYHCDEIYLSCYPDNQVAIALYEKAGFRFNGEKDVNGEDVMVLRLEN